MTHWIPFFVLALAASGCAASKGPPPHIAEVPIDDGSPRAGGAAVVGASSAAASPELSGDPSAAFGGGAGGGGAGGGGAGGGGAGAAAAAGRGGAPGAEGFPVQLPALLPQMTDVPTASAATSPSKPLPSKAERLSSSECNKLMDKYIELVGISQGIAPDAIAGVMTMLRNSVSSDANYSNALGACGKENTKTQYRCAMKANDVDGWKKCLQ